MSVGAPRGRSYLLFGLVVLGVGIACGSSSSGGPTGGPVSGALDKHCSLPDGGVIAQVTDLSTCHLSADAGTTDYGPTLYNSSGDDDDCKYHLSDHEGRRATSDRGRHPRRGVPQRCPSGPKLRPGNHREAGRGV